MKRIKLSGREASVLKGIDFSVGTTRAELLEHTHLSREDLVDIVNGLMEVGFVECEPMRESIDDACLDGIQIEVNPSYALALRDSLKKAW